MTRRSAILGYVFLIVLLSGGAAQSLSGANTVYTDDIVNGQVKTPDLADNAVSGSKILNSSITGADVATNGLTGSDIATNSISSGDIANSTLHGGKVFDDSLTGADIDESTLGLPLARQVFDNDTGLLCNTEYCTEGTIVLGPGTYSITGKIVVEADGASDYMHVACLLTGGNSTIDNSSYSLSENATRAPIPLQGIYTVPASTVADISIKCTDSGNDPFFEEYTGKNLAITALKLGGILPEPPPAP